MFIKKLKLFFLIITVLGTFILLWSWIDSYKFKNNPLDKKITYQIEQKQNYLQSLSYKKFKIDRKFPVIISDKMPSKLFGAATLDEQGKIKIYLNKKRFKESSDYMLHHVLPHEYAHAIMFAIGDTTNINGGHTLKWQKICLALEGLKCDRYVNHNDIIFGKTNLF